MVEGFGEGTEDAKVIARYVDRIRKDGAVLYAWFTQIAQHRAWTPRFYEAMKAKYPEEITDDFKTTFYKWKNAFSASWPNLLVEPDSEKAKAEKVKHETMVDTVEALVPILDPTNLAILVQWFADTISQSKTLFPIPLELNADTLAQFAEEKLEQARKLQEEGALGAGGDDDEPKEPKPKAIHDDADEVPHLPLRGGGRLNGGSGTVTEIVRAVDAARAAGHA
jgi:hypothetical protein